MLADDAAGVGDVYLGETMDDMFSSAQAAGIQGETTLSWDRDDAELLFGGKTTTGPAVDLPDSGLRI